MPSPNRYCRCCSAVEHDLHAAMNSRARVIIYAYVSASRVSLRPSCSRMLSSTPKWRMSFINRTTTLLRNPHAQNCTAPASPCRSCWIGPSFPFLKGFVAGAWEVMGTPRRLFVVVSTRRNVSRFQSVAGSCFFPAALAASLAALILACAVALKLLQERKLHCCAGVGTSVSELSSDRTVGSSTGSRAGPPTPGAGSLSSPKGRSSSTLA
mmetsp:Transcript_21146/g.47407  ORF Transcript_21146/g.47407 Transcript_21146/m.47407 type:complete len:210 (-) Transcript_21146:60-689(-)